MTTAEWWGVALGGGAIALTAFLYYFDVLKIIRGLREGSASAEKARLEAETQMLSQIDRDIVKYHSQLLESLNEKLTVFDRRMRSQLLEIREKQEGILSKEQALQMVDLYLHAVNAELRVALYDLDEKKLLPLWFDDRRHSQINSAFHDIYDKVVRLTIRNLVKPFRLRGNIPFDTFVSKVNSDAVNEAFARAQGILQAANPSDYPRFLAEMREILRLTGELGGSLMRGKIEEIYRDPIDK